MIHTTCPHCANEYVEPRTAKTPEGYDLTVFECPKCNWMDEDDPEVIALNPWMQNRTPRMPRFRCSIELCPSFDKPLPVTKSRWGIKEYVCPDCGDSVIDFGV